VGRAATEADQTRPVDILNTIPANNVPARAILLERCRALLRRLIAAQGLNWSEDKNLSRPMSKVIRSPFQAASGEMIAKLVKAGYLLPALRNDADAITRAIAQMRQDLRGRSGDDDARSADDGPSAA
jgi:hypothetical protein